MTFSICSLGKSVPWISAVVILSITCASFFGYRVFSLLFTSLVLILSTILFTLFLKKKPVPVKNFVQDEALISSEKEEQEGEEVVQLQPESEAIVQNKEEAQEENGEDQSNECLAIRSADLCSKSKSIDQSFTSEESDVEWPYFDEAAHSLDFSEGSISDEESLIEIALPSGQYVGTKEEDKYSLPRKLPYFSPETIFRQHGLMELLAEFNEEENLIEIDISMGSIKCSRFEIEA